jgi:hypothetical protein
MAQIVHSHIGACVSVGLRAKMRRRTIASLADEQTGNATRRSVARVERRHAEMKPVYHFPREAR